MRNDLYSLINEMNNLFSYDEGYSTIKVDVVEEDHGYKVYAEMPGLNKEDISITFEDSVLTIEGVVKKMNNTRYLIHERQNVKLKRSISFNDIDEEELTASYENGILIIDIKVRKPLKKEKRNITIA